jgi:hypothetical protein
MSARRDAVDVTDSRAKSPIADQSNVCDFCRQDVHDLCDADSCSCRHRRHDLVLSLLAEEHGAPSPRTSKPALVGFISAITASLLVATGFLTPGAWVGAGVAALLAIVCAAVGRSEINASQGRRTGEALVTTTWLIIAMTLAVLGAVAIAQYSRNFPTT